MNKRLLYRDFGLKASPVQAAMFGPDSRAGNGNGGGAPALLWQTSVAADSPDLWYRFDETSGTTITDSSGNALDGSLEGNFPAIYARDSVTDDTSTGMKFFADTAYTDGRRVNASAFDGNLFWVATAKTIEAIVTPNPGENFVVFCATVTDDLRKDNRLVISPSWSGYTNTLVFRISKGNQREEWTLPQNDTITPGEANHIAVTITGASPDVATVYFHVNGTKYVGTKTSDKTVSSWQDCSNTRIGGIRNNANFDGSGAWSDYYYNGTIHEVMFYSSVISDANLSARNGYLSASTKEWDSYIFEDAPDHWFRFFESSGTTAESTVSTDTLTHVNTPTLAATSILSTVDTPAISYVSANSEYSKNVGIFTGTWTSWTVEIAFRLDAVDQLQALWSYGSVSQGDQYTRLQVESDNTLSFIVRKDTGTPGANYYQFTGMGSLSAGTVYHVVIACDGVSTVIYLNGSDVTNLTSGSDGALALDVHTYGDEEFLLGANVAFSTYADYADMTLDECVLYTSALASARVTAHNGAK